VRVGATVCAPSGEDDLGACYLWTVPQGGLDLDMEYYWGVRRELATHLQPATNNSDLPQKHDYLCVDHTCLIILHVWPVCYPRHPGYYGVSGYRLLHCEEEGKGRRLAQGEGVTSLSPVTILLTTQDNDYMHSYSCTC